jgi:hypothetical protein
MTSQNPESATAEGDDPRVMIIGPDGTAMPGARTVDDDRDDRDDGDDRDPDGERNITELVEQPAKVMRIGGMIRQLLEEVKSAPLDEASRTRLADIYESSIKELEGGLAPELVEELERLSLPFSSETRRRRSCGSRRPSSSAGSRGCSTASRPRSTPSRWPPVPSSSRCVGRCRRG